MKKLFIILSVSVAFTGCGTASEPTPVAIDSSAMMKTTDTVKNIMDSTMPSGGDTTKQP